MLVSIAWSEQMVELSAVTLYKNATLRAGTQIKDHEKVKQMSNKGIQGQSVTLSKRKQHTRLGADPSIWSKYYIILIYTLIINIIHILVKCSLM